MLVQKDVLLRQIHMLVAALIEKAGGQGKPVEEPDLEASVGLGLDVAEHMPLSTVLEILGGDGARCLAIGLALARRADRRVATGDFDGAARAGLAAEPLIDEGLRRRPDLDSPDLRAARATLHALWGDDS